MKYLLASFLLALSLFAIAPAAYADTADVKVLEPVLQVPIPGLNFEGSVIAGTAEDDGCPEGYVCVGTIGLYLNAIYKYAFGAGIVLCIVILMIAGVEWMIGATVDKIQKAQNRIRKALMGLLILLGTAALVGFINPNALSLNSLKVKLAENIPPPPSEQMAPLGNFAQRSIQRDAEGNEIEIVSFADVMEDDGSGTTAHRNIYSACGTDCDSIHIDVADKVQDVANDLVAETGFKLKIVQAYTSPERTAKDFYRKCIVSQYDSDISYDIDECRTACNPFPQGEIVEGDLESGFKLVSSIEDAFSEKSLDEKYEFLQAEAANATETKCPYSSGYALAVFCEDDSATSVTIRCQTVLEELMDRNGFARGYEAPWHWEWKRAAILGSVRNGDAKLGTVLVPEDRCAPRARKKPVVYTTTGESDVCADDYAEICQVWGYANLLSGRCKQTP